MASLQTLDVELCDYIYQFLPYADIMTILMVNHSMALGAKYRIAKLGSKFPKYKGYRYINALASQGYLTVIQWCYNRRMNIMEQSHLVAHTCIKGGHKTLLNWLLGMRPILISHCKICAAELGQLSILKYLLKKFSAVTSGGDSSEIVNLIKSAAVKGKTDIIMYLTKTYSCHGINYYDLIIASKGHVDLLLWIAENHRNFKIPRQLGAICSMLIGTQNISVLEKYYSIPGLKLPQLINDGHKIRKALSTNNIELLNWMASKGVIFNNYLATSIRYCNIDTLDWLMVHYRFTLNSRLYNKAVKNRESIAIFKWLNDKGCPHFNDTSICADIVSKSNLSLLKWVRNREIHGDNVFSWDGSSCYNAVCNGNMEILEYLRDENIHGPYINDKQGRCLFVGARPNNSNNNNNNTGESLCIIATKSQRLDILKWLCDSDGDSDVDTPRQCKYGYSSFETALSAESFSIIKWLVASHDYLDPARCYVVVMNSYIQRDKYKTKYNMRKAIKLTEWFENNYSQCMELHNKKSKKYYNNLEINLAKGGDSRKNYINKNPFRHNKFCDCANAANSSM
jgi:hypothetical protein